MLQHILKKNLLLITASASEAGPGFRAGAGIGFGIPLTGGHQIRADASYSSIYNSFTHTPKLTPRIFMRMLLLLSKPAL